MFCFRIATAIITCEFLGGGFLLLERFLQPDSREGGWDAWRSSQLILILMRMAFVKTCQLSLRPLTNCGIPAVCITSALSCTVYCTAPPGRQSASSPGAFGTFFYRTNRQDGHPPPFFCELLQRVVVIRLLALCRSNSGVQRACQCVGI